MAEKRGPPPFQRISTGLSRDPSITPSCIKVLLCVASYADQTERAWPSQRVVARQTGLSIRSVRSCIATLCEKALLSVERDKRPGRPKKGDQTSRSANVYIVAPQVRATIAAQELGAETASLRHGIGMKCGNGLPHIRPEVRQKTTKEVRQPIASESYTEEETTHARARALIRARVGEAAFKKWWLGKLEEGGIKGDTVTFFVSTRFIADSVQRDHEGDFLDVARALFIGVERVKITTKQPSDRETATGEPSTAEQDGAA